MYSGMAAVEAAKNSESPRTFFTHLPWDLLPSSVAVNKPKVGTNRHRCTHTVLYACCCCCSKQTNFCRPSSSIEMSRMYLSPCMKCTKTRSIWPPRTRWRPSTPLQSRSCRTRSTMLRTSTVLKATGIVETNPMFTTCLTKVFTR